MSALDIITAALANVLPNFNKSNGTIEAKIIDVVGTFADTQIIERNRTVSAIQQSLASQRVTTVEYYRRKAVQYQQGDTLIYDPVNQGGYYAEYNPEARIIKQAYITGTHPLFTLLVNALDNAGHLRKLTLEELSGFKTYFKAFQPIGLDLVINSMEAAKISDPNIVIYVRSGTDAASVAASINALFIAHEAVLRTTNTVTISELEKVIQQNADVVAIGFSSELQALETKLDGTTQIVKPVEGVFNLITGAFTFTTEITVDNIKNIQ